MKYIAVLTIFSLFLSGCATAPRVASVYPLPSPAQEGFYHTVTEGETLWRIAKLYNVEISKIIEANRLSDPSKIEKDQMLFIPSLKRSIKPSYQDITAVGFIWPANGKVISYFGQKRHNVTNSGIDIVSCDGTSVIASQGGVVSFCDDQVKGYGKTIIIEHKNGYSTVYAYNSKNLVSAGQHVKKGQAIAMIGKSSRSDDYILHFEIRKRQKPQDPFYYLP